MEKAEDAPARTKRLYALLLGKIRNPPVEAILALEKEPALAVKLLLADCSIFANVESAVEYAGDSSSYFITHFKSLYLYAVFTQAGYDKLKKSAEEMSDAKWICRAHEDTYITFRCTNCGIHRKTLLEYFGYDVFELENYPHVVVLKTVPAKYLLGEFWQFVHAMYENYTDVPVYPPITCGAKSLLYHVLPMEARPPPKKSETVAVQHTPEITPGVVPNNSGAIIGRILDMIRIAYEPNKKFSFCVTVYDYWISERNLLIGFNQPEHPARDAWCGVQHKILFRVSPNDINDMLSWLLSALEYAKNFREGDKYIIATPSFNRQEHAQYHIIEPYKW